ncbi:GerAB/ArcD/ProY family transporter [Bacillus sp. RD4P76]|uniref:GerAB/ArcD/ProY family transporter n=1 Tax=Bacillus suaedaesalsae TaxID=2810349 RepID=A0ABS2DHB6_9BACI|nr:GerAB/ArcD/ProY family transporter [Bacillus suaedaesalsae]
MHVMMMYVICHLGLIFFMFPADIIASTDQGHWFPISVGIIVHFLCLLIYMKGLSFFPKKDILSIFSGRRKGVTFLFFTPILLYLIIVIIITTRAYSEIITLVFLSHTPLWAIILLLLFVSAYIAAKGIETIIRTALLLALLFIPIILFVFIISFQNVDWRYALPLDTDLSFLFKPEYLESYFAFSGGFIFLGFVQPYFSYERKYITLSAVFLIPFFLFSVYIPILTLGQATASTTFLPFVVILDSINIDWFMFDRVTMFFLLSLISFIFLYISLVMWKAIRIINFFIPKRSANYFLIGITVFAFAVCFWIPDWKDVEDILFMNSFLRIYVLIIVPLYIYYLGKRFKRKGTNETT